MTPNVFDAGLEAHFNDRQRHQLASVRVGIAGAGGLGSNAAAHLVRSGIRRLVIADFDRVEASNLNRQFYFMDQVGMKKVAALQTNLQRINPDLDIQTRDIRLDADTVRDIFAPCQVIVEALDRAGDKKMMADAFMPDARLLVCASGVGGWGRSDRIRTRRVNQTFFLIGDGATDVSANTPPTAAIVGIAAAKQADVVIEMILNGKVAGSRGAPNR